MNTVVLLSMALVVIPQASCRWPSIRPLHSEARFADITLGDDTPVKVTIDGLDGVPQYLIECHNGEYDGQHPINFSGSFHCGVFALDEGGVLSSGNLLTENTRASRRSDYMNRGRFLSTHLLEPCASVLDFGARRTFRFRGMLLTIELGDLGWSVAPAGHRVPRRFTARFIAKPDPEASSMTAEVSRHPRPSGCSQ